MWMPGTSFNRWGDGMTNDEKIALYNELGKKINQLHAERKWEERNTFVPQLREIYLEIDWGFRQGGSSDNPKMTFSMYIMRIVRGGIIRVFKLGTKGGNIVKSSFCSNQQT